LQLGRTCRDGEEALQILPKDTPDVVLMDINLPKLNGIECVRRLKALLPAVQILMLTVYEDSEKIFRSLLAGANGYLLKRTPQNEIMEAIAEVHRGNSPMSGHIARKVVQYFNQQGANQQVIEKLSQREREVLERLAEGISYKEIADVLALSIDTVRKHIKGIYGKLHVHSRGEAVAKYLRK
jgi:DNA-binding NarL/FixJ family response regulator